MESFCIIRQLQSSKQQKSSPLLGTFSLQYFKSFFLFTVDVWQKTWFRSENASPKRQTFQDNKEPFLWIFWIVNLAPTLVVLEILLYVSVHLLKTGFPVKILQWKEKEDYNDQMFWGTIWMTWCGCLVRKK